MSRKPFDMLVVVAPYEYNLNYSTSIGTSLRDLGDICRQHEIPVRASGEPWHTRPRFLRRQRDLLADFFSGTDYKPDFDEAELSTLDDEDQVRVMLTGGIFCYANQLELEAHQQHEVGVDLHDLIHSGDQGQTTNFVLVQGCVPRFAYNLSRMASTKSPTIYVDPRSAVNCCHEFDLDSLYSYMGHIPIQSINPYHFLFSKVPRESVIPST